MYQLYRDGEFENILFETISRACSAADKLWAMRSCWMVYIVDVTTGEVVYERGE